MKVIDLLNKIAKGEALPKRIKYKCDIYIIGEDKCNKDVRYIAENKDDDGYTNTKYLFQDWILDVILNDEVEIIEEDKELNKFDSYICNVGAVNNFEDVEKYIHTLFEQQAQLIENQKIIIAKLRDKQ